MITTLFSKIILVLFWTAQVPFSATGYACHFVSAFWFFGWSKAGKHMDWLIACSDRKNTLSNGEQTGGQK